MPIYEYRCPDGHVFEVFKRMSEPSPDACEVCGAGPLVQVLYPVAIHYKGSGFYSTDYGRGNRKPKEGGQDGGGAAGAESGDKKPAAEKNVEKKAAAAE